MEEIFKRRSIREYTDQKISSDDITSILKAGMNAPSARNTKPISYVVIDDKKILKHLSEINQHGKMLSNASHAIAVCALESTPYWVQDAAAATQNILIAATSLGIGSCWCGIYPKDIESDIKTYLKIPEKIRLLSIVSLGYPIKEMVKNDFFDKDIIHYNEWRNNND